MDKFKVQKARQQEGYVIRNTRRTGVSKIDPISPAKAPYHGTQNEDYGFQSDIFYTQLEKFKGEYRAFFKSLDEYGKIIAMKPQEEIIDRIKAWIEVYNRLIESLIQLDADMKTQYALRIKFFWVNYEAMLYNLGIVVRNLSIQINEDRLREKLEDESENLKTAFRQKAHWMLLLYTEFLRIKSEIQTEKGPGLTSESGKGLLFDSKK